MAIEMPPAQVPKTRMDVLDPSDPSLPVLTMENTTQLDAAVGVLL